MSGTAIYQHTISGFLNNTKCRLVWKLSFPSCFETHRSIIRALQRHTHADISRRTFVADVSILVYHQKRSKIRVMIHSHPKAGKNLLTEPMKRRRGGSRRLSPMATRARKVRGCWKTLGSAVSRVVSNLMSIFASAIDVKVTKVPRT